MLITHDINKNEINCNIKKRLKTIAKLKVLVVDAVSEATSS